MGNNNIQTVVLVIAGFVLLLFGLDFLGVNLPGRAAVAPDGTVISTDGTIIQVQTNPEDVSVKYNDFDMEDQRNDPGTQLRIYSPDRGNTSDDGSETFAPNSQFLAIAGFGDTTYYGKAITVDVGRKDPLDLEVQLARSGSLTITVRNDDEERNAAGEPQEVDANDKREIEISYDVSSNKYWGNPQAPGQSVLVIEYNKTLFNDMKVIDAIRAPVPSAFSRAANWTADTAWFIPNLVDGVKGKIILELESTGTDPPTSSGDFNMTFYDVNIDLNRGTRTLLYGIEDEDNTPIFLQKASKLVYVD